MSISSDQKKLIDNFAVEEAKWFDDIFRRHYPFLTKQVIERMAPGKFRNLITIALVKASGFKIVRNQDMELMRGGRKMMVKSVRVKIFKYGKPFEEKKFDVGAFIT